MYGVPPLCIAESFYIRKMGMFTKKTRATKWPIYKHLKFRKNYSQNFHTIGLAIKIHDNLANFLEIIVTFVHLGHILSHWIIFQIL